nr:putative disease resistance RPP13-like protein 1 [Ziziphus jujuba var. spinosa]
MGGIGKTTLAQLVYNDERVKNCFGFKAWVSVSNEFDIFKITKIITERVTNSQTFHNSHDLDLLQVRLQEALEGRKFLLILDDVWNEDYFEWEELKKPFQSGACGSKIIVTTRNESVASVMRNNNIPSYQMQTLSDENCWKLFVKHAFNDADPYAHSKLVEIGSQIVKKCKGLLLAVKSLGSILRYQLSLEEWETVLKSDMLWMAEDLLEPQNNKRIEKVGEEYFDDLLSRSLLSKSVEYSASGLLYLNLSETMITEVPNIVCSLYNLQTLILSHCQELKLFPSETQRLILRRLDIKFTGLERMPFEMGNLKILQTLNELIVGKYSGYTIQLLKDLQHLHGKLCFRRLENIVKVEDVLEANLKEKKYLTKIEFCSSPDDSSNNSREDVASVASYRHLGTCLKDLTVSGFDELMKVGNKFYYSGCSVTTTRPFRCLESFSVYDMEKCEDWSFIEGDGVAAFPKFNDDSIALDYGKMFTSIRLEYCRNLKHLTYLKQPPATLSLKRLYLRYCLELESFPKGGLHAPNLEELEIVDCEKLRSLPKHMQTTVPSLLILYLSNCPQLESFPECSMPCNLRQLDIIKCDKLLASRRHWNLQSLTSLSVGDIDVVLDSFPDEGLLPTTLINLSIGWLPHLKALDGKAFRHLTSVQKLEISGCYELQCLPEEGLPASLSELNIYGCSKLEGRCQRDTGQDRPKISHIPHILVDYEEI